MWDRIHGVRMALPDETIEQDETIVEQGKSSSLVLGEALVDGMLLNGH